MLARAAPYTMTPRLFHGAVDSKRQHSGLTQTRSFVMSPAALEDPALSASTLRTALQKCGQMGLSTARVLTSC